MASVISLPHIIQFQTAGVKTQLWPGAIVYYAFDSSLSESFISNIVKAMEWWTTTTCVRFIKRTTQPDYVVFQALKSGCFSNVGYLGRKQLINVNTGCGIAAAAHEIGHTLGLWHEQSRPDRDTYVVIHYENIHPDRVGNFNKQSNVDTRGLPYDYGSLMHYGKKAFTTNGKDTIEVIETAEYIEQGSPEIGQRQGLSDGDIAIVNKMYCPC